MSRLARPVSIVLAVLLVLLSAAACSKKSDDNKPSDSSTTPSTTQNGNNASNSGTGTETEGGADGEWKPQSDLSKKVKFSYASVQAIEGYDYTKGDPLAQYYSEKFNYEMDVAALNWDNWNERMRIWINSGDMPDVAVYNYIHADARAADGESVRRHVLPSARAVHGQSARRSAAEPPVRVHPERLGGGGRLPGQIGLHGIGDHGVRTTGQG
jgi:hypothetical protein